MKTRAAGLVFITILFLGVETQAREVTDKGPGALPDDAVMFKALPEILDDEESQVTSLELTDPRMKCFVDTRDYDEYHYDYCKAYGTALYTTVSFKIDGAPSDTIAFLWSDSRCRQESSSCTLPIALWETITLGAYVIWPGSWDYVEATASYLPLW